MYKLYLIFILFSSSISFAQDSLSFSYYLESSACEIYESINGFKSGFNGAYQLKEKERNQMRIAAGDQLIIDENGMYISKNKLLNISREEVRENSQYIVKDGYLFGVSKVDSFPVALQGESYYFLLPYKSFLFENLDVNQKLIQVSPSTFIVLTKEHNGYYSGLKISIKNAQISLAELDLSYKQINSIRHTITSENDIKTFLMNPSKKDWQIILNSFVVYDSYFLKK
jgi:hypothetical protein